MHMGRTMICRHTMRRHTDRAPTFDPCNYVSRGSKIISCALSDGLIELPGCPHIVTGIHPERVEMKSTVKPANIE